MRHYVTIMWYCTNIFSANQVSLNFVRNTVKHGNKVLLSYQCKRKKRIIRFNRYIKYSKKLNPSGLERKKK